MVTNPELKILDIFILNYSFNYLCWTRLETKN